MNVKLMLLSLALVAVACLLLIHSIELHRVKRALRELDKWGTSS